ncbi:MAG TPA: polysaccharide deacetylase family protein [Xanthobacteraceae bacterium]|nr:polysaccharide deacetylase family protein [Xanthobacteraceae bacterium]
MADLRNSVFRVGLEALYFSGAHHVLRPLYGGVGAIFTLHHVRPRLQAHFQPNRLLEIEPAFLERVIVRLRERGVDLVSIDEMRRRLVERDFSRHFVALTFDDGYRDNLEFALPILERYQAPFALFVATSFPDRLGELWWVALERVVAKAERIVVEINGEERFFYCERTAKKYEVYAQLYWWLRSLDDEKRMRGIVRDLCRRYGVDFFAPCREFCMTWPEIAEMAKSALATIGAHTVNHPMLAKCTLAEARAEMQRSREVIEAALGQPCRHFAFPVGDKTSAGPREFQLAVELGFATAVTTRPGVLYPEHRQHLTALPRVSLNGHFQAARFVDVFLSGAPFALWNGFQRVDAA